MFTNKIINLFFTIIGSSFIFGQEDSLSTANRVHEIDEVVVSATRQEQKIKDLPIQVQVISKKEIDQINTVRLSELLNEQTGLVTVPDFGGEGIQMQGFDSEYTLIMVDGVPLVGRTTGTLDLNRIAIGNVERVEMMKGASSSLYGNEALGGIINIITRKAKNGISTQLNYKVASFDTHDISSLFNYKKNKFSVHTFVNANTSNGYDLNEETAEKTVDAFRNYTFNTKMMYDFSDKNKLTLSGRYYIQNQDINIDAIKGDSRIREWNVLGKYNHQFNKKWNAYTEVYVTEHHAFDNFKNSEASGSNFKHRMLRPELRVFYKMKPKHHWVGGVGLTYEKLEKNLLAENPSFSSPYIYVQYDGYLTSKTNFIVGARYDFHNKYESQLSPKLALKHQWNDKISLRGSVGYGFKTPDFRTLYYDFTNSAVGYTVLGYNVIPKKIPQMQTNGLIKEIYIPISYFENNSLKPESSVAYNLGFDFKWSHRWEASVNFFRNDVKDLINVRAIAKKTNDYFVYSYENVSKVYTQGLELNTKLKINDEITIKGGYQLLYAYNKAAEKKFENGKIYAKDENAISFKLKKKDYYGLYNRSRHMANLKLFYHQKKWGLDANYRITYRSKYGNVDTNSNGYLDKYDKFVKGYFISDLAINKTLFKNYKIGLGIDNIFDFTNPQNISNIAGRILYGTIKINF